MCKMRGCKASQGDPNLIFAGPSAHWRVGSSVFDHLVVPPYPPARDPGPRQVGGQLWEWRSCCLFFPILVALLSLLALIFAFFPPTCRFLSIFYQFLSIFGSKIHPKIDEKNRSKINAKLPSKFVRKMFQRALFIKSGKSISTAKTYIKINIFINQW